MDLLPECETAAWLYAAAQTQWRYGPSGQIAGLDYAGVEALARMREQRIEPYDWELVQAAERAALDLVHERKSPMMG